MVQENAEDQKPPRVFRRLAPFSVHANIQRAGPQHAAACYQVHTGAPALYGISLGQVSLVNSVVVDFVNSVVDFVNSAFVLVGAPALHSVFLGQVFFVNSVVDFVNGAFGWNNCTAWCLSGASVFCE